MMEGLDPALHAEGCDAIVRGLPGWFGVAAGIEDCARAVRTQAGFVAMDGDAVVGFVTFEPLPYHDWEITWMAVRADRRGGGIGTDLVERLVTSLPHDPASLIVKTVSDRDGDPGAEYRATRAFYLARGFRPIAELDIWGPENPCQVLARPVGDAPP
jgi:predicted N-acetyltransferase YhbS